MFCYMKKEKKVRTPFVFLKECNIPLIVARHRRGLSVFVAINCGLVGLNSGEK